MKKLILFISLSTLIFIGCSVKKEGDFTHVKIDKKRTVWINKNVECCGFKDPINNFEWLKEDYDRAFKQYEQTGVAAYVYYCYFLLFHDNLTSTHYIVRKSSMWKYSNFLIRECDGAIIDMGVFDDGENPNKMLDNNSEEWYEDPPYPCISCDRFFKTHTLVDTIFYYVIQP